jgi:hypothetical protein
MSVLGLAIIPDGCIVLAILITYSTGKYTAKFVGLLQQDSIVAGRQHLLESRKTTGTSTNDNYFRHILR